MAPLSLLATPMPGIGGIAAPKAKYALSRQWTFHQDGSDMAGYFDLSCALFQILRQLAYARQLMHVAL